MRRFVLTHLAPLAALCSIPLLAFAQDSGDAAAGAASGLAGCGCCGTFIAIPITVVVLNIALLVWVARDAKARGMDSAILWMLLVFCTSIVGLIIYLLSRPKGDLVRCPNCNNQKLQAAMRCPHCGFGA